ncbi:efflux RND transporter periplasmic adaptor subunit [Parafilimonas sp.]|uniref:efflux RND transporter periplasmic adaptor subunit n=1 Tax=Parafilimonas sp. TaxID=1969739 RepID=UPI0039E299A5
MKKKKLIIIVLVLIAVAVAAWFLFFKKEEQVVVVKAEKPTIGNISESVTATGTVEPVDTVAVGTQVSGTVNKIYVDFNSTVKKGQLLLELDATLFQASVDQAAANVAEQQSALVYQQANFNRQKQLFEVGAISRQDYDNALYTLNAAKASVASLQAQLHTAQKNLSLSKIYAPNDGIVLSRDVSEGQTVAASYNTPTLFVIAKDINRMQVKANVDEADIGNITDGLRATFTVDAFINDVFNGTVQEVRLNPTSSSNVVTYTTIINASNEDQKLKPGMTANITIFTKEADTALLVPVKAIKYKPDSSLSSLYKIVPLKGIGEEKSRQDTARSNKAIVDSSSITAYVWVKQGNELIQKKVVTGLNDNTHVEILSGLSGNDEVVTESEVVSAKTAAQQGEASSPFMPKRPGRSSSSSKKKS